MKDGGWIGFLWGAARIASLRRLDGKSDDALVTRLGEHIADVEVHRAFCDAEFGGDLIVCLAVAMRCRIASSRSVSGLSVPPKV